MLKYVRQIIHKIVARQRLDESKHLLVLGNQTYGVENLRIHHWNGQNKLVVGAYCSIADSVHVFLGGNHRMEWATTFPFSTKSAIAQGIIHGSRDGCVTSKGNVIIGTDVWIGSHASIMSGVSIGSGAVIAAYSHVVKDVEPYEIVGGNPAKHIRFRFNKTVIERLERLAWWNWPEEVVFSNVDLLCSEIDENSLEVLEQLDIQTES